MYIYFVQLETHQSVPQILYILINKNQNFVSPNVHLYMVASKAKCVNSVLNIIGVNSLRLGGLRLIFTLNSSVFVNKTLKL